MSVHTIHMVQARGAEPSACPMPFPCLPLPNPQTPPSPPRPLPPNDIFEKLAALLQTNELACGLRLACRHTAALLATANTTVTLSQPVPRPTSTARWGLHSSMRCLSREQQQQLLLLTFRSGCMYNVKTLLSRKAWCLPVLVGP